MSGLAGRFFADGVDSPELSSATAARLFAGPNVDPRIRIEDNVTLVVASRFPSSSVDGSFAEIVVTDEHVLAVEGYVLNLSDLAVGHSRDSPPGRGHALLELFARYGAEELVRRVNGGYHLVIWSKAERTATVATGKFGQRTLYTIAAGDSVTVASDLHALRVMAQHRFELDTAAIYSTLLEGAVAGGRTTLANVRRLLPGSTMIVRNGSASERPAGDIPGALAPPPRRPTSGHLNELDDLMRQAASRVSHISATQAVMIGSGIDSSLLAVYARAATTNLTAVTQQMPGRLDETAGAARLVAALGLPHRIVPYEPETANLLQDAAAFVRVAEEPAYWNQLGPPLLRLLRALPDRPDGFLTGAEGDLLFNFRRGRPPVADVIRSGVFWPVAQHTARRLINRVTRHTYLVGSDFDLLDRRLMRAHISSECRAAGEPARAHATPQGGPAARATAYRHFVANGWQNVRIISQLARDAGCEVLFPYLDDDVVACVLSLPEELKINKILLRLLLGRFLSPSLVPTRKHGYWAHTIQWHYEARTLPDVLDFMSEQRTLDRGVYDRAAVRRLVAAYARNAAAPEHHPVLWQLLVFEAFCREFVDRA